MVKVGGVRVGVGTVYNLRRYSCRPYPTACLVLPSPPLVSLSASAATCRCIYKELLFVSPEPHADQVNPWREALVQMVVLCPQTTRCCLPSSTTGMWWVRPRCRAWTAALWLSPQALSAAWSRWCFPSLARKSPPSAC